LKQFLGLRNEEESRNFLKERGIEGEKIDCEEYEVEDKDSE
jgi:hypothetical protein